jgi:hypothetical protein
VLASLEITAQGNLPTLRQEKNEVLRNPSEEAVFLIFLTIIGLAIFACDSISAL